MSPFTLPESMGSGYIQRPLFKISKLRMAAARRREDSEAAEAHTSMKILDARYDSALNE